MYTNMESISRNKSHVMLLKLPEFLYEALNSAHSEPLTLSYDDRSGSCELSLPRSLEDAAKGILKYKGKVASLTDDPLYVFSVDWQRRASLKAKVIMRGAVNPERNANFDKLTKHRNNQTSAIRTHTAEPKPEDLKIQSRVFHLHEDHNAYILSNPERALEATQRKRLGEKRVRGDREKVKDALFSLFAHQRYWKLKALADETDEPEASLTEILQEIGEKVISGPYRKHWQLKKEYREDEESDKEDVPVKKQKLS